MTVVLALDLATRTGWAIRPDLGGVWDLKPPRGSSPGMRFLRLRGRLNEVHGDLRPGVDLVAFEQPHYRGGHATEVLAGLVGELQSWCADHDVEHLSVSTGTLKKYATGNGNASKADMVKAARERGWDPVDHNHADALHLLAYVAEVEGIGRTRGGE